jgi:hypothetical protein
VKLDFRFAKLEVKATSNFVYRTSYILLLPQQHSYLNPAIDRKSRGTAKAGMAKMHGGGFIAISGVDVWVVLDIVK